MHHFFIFSTDQDSIGLPPLTLSLPIHLTLIKQLTHVSFGQLSAVQKALLFRCWVQMIFSITGHGLTWTGSLVLTCSDVAQVMCCKSCHFNKQFRQWWPARSRNRSCSRSSYSHVESHCRYECSWWMSPQTPVKSALEIALPTENF